MLAVTLPIVAAILAIAATVLAFIFIVPEKKRPSLNKPLQILHDVLNFKFLIIEKIMQALYIFSNAFVLIYGVFSLFSFSESYDYDWYSGEVETSLQWNGWVGFLIILLGPIILRISYELIMMTILLIKNVTQINNKLKNQNESSDSTSLFDTPKVEFSRPKAPAQPAAPTYPTYPAQPVNAVPAQPVPAQPVNAAPAQTVSANFCVTCGAPTVDGHCPNGHQ